MLDADADAEPYARADAETDADADACADAETDASYYTVTGAGTDDVGIETTNCPRPIQGRAGRPAGSTRRTGLNGLTAIILCLLPFANGLGRASRGLLPTKRPIVRKWTGRARD